jgi:TolB protein
MMMSARASLHLTIRLAVCFSVGLIAALWFARNHMQSYEIAYMAYTRINPDIFRADVQRHIHFNLTQHPDYDGAPAWSPDGASIAFMSTRDGQPRIYLMNANSGQTRALTPLDGAYSAPRWSRDGRRLYMFGYGNTAQTVYSVTLDGTELTQLDLESGVGSFERTLDIDPFSINDGISPDGARKLFPTYRNGAWQLYVGQPDRSEQQLIATLGREYTGEPSWSRDGKQIAVIASSPDGIDVFVFAADPNAPNPIRMTTTSIIEANVVWRP